MAARPIVLQNRFLISENRIGELQSLFYEVETHKLLDREKKIGSDRLPLFIRIQVQILEAIREEKREMTDMERGMNENTSDRT